MDKIIQLLALVMALQAFGILATLDVQDGQADTQTKVFEDPSIVKTVHKRGQPTERRAYLSPIFEIPRTKRQVVPQDDQNNKNKSRGKIPPGRRPGCSGRPGGCSALRPGSPIITQGR